MKVVEIKLSDLKLYENNPRKNDNAVDAVAASFKNFGVKIPLVIDKNNVIVCGHTRYKAAQKIGLETLPCILADDLNEEQIKAFRLADNKTAELSGWDFEKVQEELAKIQDVIDMRQFEFIIEDDGKTYISNQEYENDELDLDSFGEKNYKYVCKCCGFRWGKI